jgi:hypothetical protein
MGAVLKMNSKPLLLIVPRFTSWLPTKPVDGAIATCMSASFVFLL